MSTFSCFFSCFFLSDPRNLLEVLALETSISFFAYFIVSLFFEGLFPFTFCVVKEVSVVFFGNELCLLFMISSAIQLFSGSVSFLETLLDFALVFFGVVLVE